MSVDGKTRQCVGVAVVSGLLTLVSCFLPWEVVHPEKMKGLVGVALDLGGVHYYSGWVSSVGPPAAEVGNWMVAVYCLSTVLVLWLQAIGSFPGSRLIPSLLLLLGASHICYLLITVHGAFTPAIPGPVVAGIGIVGIAVAMLSLPRAKQGNTSFGAHTATPAP